jgi:hypothetical protein
LVSLYPKLEAKTNTFLPIALNSGANKEDKVGLESNFISFVVGTEQQIVQLQAALEKALN